MNFFPKAILESLESRQLLAALPAPLAEVLAKGVAYANWTQGQVINFDGANLGYTVARVFTDNTTGFNGLGLIHEEYGPALVSRGTQGNPNDFQFADILADAHPKGIGYDQFSKNWNAVRGWLSTLHTGVDVIGHSLGGALTQWFASAWSRDHNDGIQPVDQVYTFCAPGITDNKTLFPSLITYASSFDDSRVRSVEHHIVIGDAIVMAGEKYIKGIVKTARFSTLNLLNKHKLPVLNASIAGDLRPAGVVFGTMPLATLNSPSYVHDDPDYRSIVLILQLVTDGLAATNRTLTPLKLVPPLLMSRATAEASRKVIGGMLRAAVGTYTATINGAGQLVVALKGALPALYKATTFTFDRSFTINRAGTPPTLTFNGGMRLRLGTDLQIPIPGWLGGPIPVDHLLELGNFDVNGVIDATSMRINGQLSVLGGLARVDGSAKFNWSNSKIEVSGSAGFMNNFVSATGTMSVTGSGDMYMSGSGTVRIPAGSKIFPGRTLGNGQFTFNFTNNGNLADDYLEGYGTLGRLRAGLRVYLNGTIRGVGLLKLLSTGFGESDGESYDVPTGQDWLLLQGAWENASSTARLKFVSPSGQELSEEDLLANPENEIVADLTDPQNRAMYIADPTPGTWQVEVVDAAGLGETTYDAHVDVPSPTGSFSSVSGGKRRQDVQVQLNVVDPSSSATVALYFERDGTGANATLIAQGLVPDGAGVVDYTWDVASVPTGDAHVFAVVTAPDAIETIVYSPSHVTITEVQPTIIDEDFEFEESQAIVLKFDQDVSQSLELSDLTLTNLTTNQTVPLDDLLLTYDIYTDTATLTAPGASSYGIAGVLPDGDYRLTAAADSITNTDGEFLADDVAFDFFALMGDANHDHIVDFDDYVLIDNGYNNGLSGYSNGDFNYDGVIDFDDYVLIDLAFNSQ